MPKQKAKDHYLGKNGCQRMNCAQSVLAAHGASDDLLYEFSMYGGGRAPEGFCGAAYAAVTLSGDKAGVEKAFLEKAGAITCTEIRMNRKLSCVGCVETGAELVKK